MKSQKSKPYVYIIDDTWMDKIPKKVGKILCLSESEKKLILADMAEREFESSKTLKYLVCFYKKLIVEARGPWYESEFAVCQPLAKKVRAEERARLEKARRLEKKREAAQKKAEADRRAKAEADRRKAEIKEEQEYVNWLVKQSELPDSIHTPTNRSRSRK